MKKRERGILTVEASIVLTLMLLFILFLFSFARIYRAQNLVSHAALQTADAVALESYLRETALQSNTSDVVYLASHISQSSAISMESLESLRSANLPKIAKEKFVAAIAKTEAQADEKLRLMGVKDGLDGVDFSECKMDLSNDDVIVAIQYTVELQFPVLGFKEITVTKAAKAKTFGEILFEVSTAPNHPGWGTTTGDANVVHGSTVEISAEPSYGYEFVGWSDGVTENPRKVTVDDAQHYVAIFEKSKFGINLGTKILYNTNYAGITHSNYGAVTGAGTYEYQDTVTITATPARNYEFDGWDDNNDGKVDNTSPSRTITVEKTYSLKAIFKPALIDVSVKSNNDAYGSAQISQGANKGTALKVEYGSIVQLLAAPKDTTKYIFTKWSNNNTQPTTTVTVREVAIYEAAFELNTYTVTFYSGNTVVHTTTVVRGSSIEGSNSVTGSTMAPNPKADKGYFTGWTCNGQSFTNRTTIKSSVQVFAQFASPSIQLSGGSAGNYSTTITAKVNPSNASVTWTSSNNSVATVSSRGVVQSKKSGTVTITAYFILDGVKYEDSVTIQIGESEHRVVYCMNMANNGRRYYTKTHTDLIKKRKWNVYFPGTNHHCHSTGCCGGHANKVVKYTVLAQSKIVSTDGSVLNDVGGYNGYNKSGEKGYIFDNGSGNAIYFEAEQTSQGPRGYYITKVTH